MRFYNHLRNYMKCFTLLNHPSISLGVEKQQLKKLVNKYIKVYEDLCDKKKCYFGANDQIFFKDGNHLSNEGLRKLTKTKNQIEVILNRN